MSLPEFSPHDIPVSSVHGASLMWVRKTSELNRFCKESSQKVLIIEF